MKLIAFILLIPNIIFAFTIYAPERLENDKYKEHINSVLVKSYKQIGINSKLEFIKEIEINKKLKSGEFDAIASKISEESTIPNAIKISPPLISSYSINRYKLKAKALVKRSITVGAIKGVKAHTKAIIKNRIKFKEVKYFDSYQDIIEALINDRIDSVLLSTFEFNQYFRSKDLVVAEQNLYQIDISHYINRKHIKIKEKLEEKLIKLKKKNKLDYRNYINN